MRIIIRKSAPSSRSRLHSWLVRRPRTLVALVALIGILTWGAAGGLAWFSYDLPQGLPDRQALSGIGDMAQATILYDASDKPVFAIAKEQRIEVPLTQVSPLLIRAVLSIEDQRFYRHRGLDIYRMVAAALANVRLWRAAQGGSTITQQLARQSFLTRDKTIRRKLKEAIVAARIEAAFSKAQILELYLNKVYFGDGFYGVEAAARGFFGKPALNVTLDEAALLAGLIKSPSTYAPTVNLDRAVSRRNVVLQSLLDDGAITQVEYEQARHSRVVLSNALERTETFGLYVKEQVRQELVERFGSQRVYEGGLHVYTTIEPAMQQAAESLMESQLAQIESRRGYKHPRRDPAVQPAGGVTTPYLQGALIAIDPRDGSIRAMVGGRSFKDSPFNRAVQAKRQPGSAFKPFVYAAALEAGYSPASVIDRLDEPVWTAQGDWSPEDGHSTASSMTLRTALRTSSNRAAVRLLQEVGIKPVVQYVSRLNIGTVPSVPSLALGAGEVTLQSMTVAYAVFANTGELVQPRLIRRIADNEGHVLFESKPQPTPAIAPSTAYLMSNMMSDVINYGTAARARSVGFTLPAAGKTGTTNDFMDAWFVGFTPTLVAGVWIGFDQPVTIISNGFAADLAVPLWAEFMKVATRGDQPTWYTPPSDIVAVDVCRLSGHRPSDGCYGGTAYDEEGGGRRLVYTEYFARGTEPTEFCAIHARSIVEGIVATLGGSHELPPAVELPPPAPAPPPPEVKIEPPVVAVAEPQPEPPKKRGFWSRVFGRGKRDEGKRNEKASKDTKTE